MQIPTVGIISLVWSCDLLRDLPPLQITTINSGQNRSKQLPDDSGELKQTDLGGELKFSTRDWQRVIFLLFRALSCLQITVAMWKLKVWEKTCSIFWPGQTEDKALGSRVMRNWEGILERIVLEKESPEFCVETLSKSLVTPNPCVWEADPKHLS